MLAIKIKQALEFYEKKDIKLYSFNEIPEKAKFIHYNDLHATIPVIGIKQNQKVYFNTINRYFVEFPLEAIFERLFIVIAEDASDEDKYKRNLNFNDYHILTKSNNPINQDKWQDLC